MTNNPTPEQLKLARKCAASLRPYSHNSALILDGERDGIDIVQVAIAAIIETAELAQKFILSQTNSDDPFGIHEDIADALRSGAHLKGSSDDQ